MPRLEERALHSPKSLLRRESRANGALQILRKSEPVRIACVLRRVIKGHLAIAEDEAEMPEVRAEAAKVAYGGIDRLLELIGHPKRPTAMQASENPIDLKRLLDVTPTPPS